MKLKNQPKDLKSLNDAARYSSMAFQMVIIIGLGVFGGIKLDDWLHMNFPVFTVLLSVIAVVLAIYYFIKDFTFMNRK
ncbi:MAG: AtpZ/AtpI family protein [Bacteroidales bacterium]|nr:AtpZ/AtpI family protein [Bacteroidales bacterium]MBN2764452.1 AtpZ/AtpI family protein [Bacteroidales bacterium]